MAYPHLLSNILRQQWQIEPFTAASYMPQVEALLEGRLNTEHKPKEAYSDPMDYYEYRPAQVGNVMVVPLMGALMKEDYCGTPGTETIGQWLEAADANPEVKAIVLHVDSAGGTSMGTSKLAETFKALQKPTITYVDEMMASAALKVGISADQVLLASTISLVGSIGTMSTFKDMKEYYAKSGIKNHEVYADTSGEKNAEFREAYNGNYKKLKERILNPMDAQFMALVKEARPEASQLAMDGATFLGQKAIDNGLADGYATMKEVLAMAEQMGNTGKRKPKANTTQQFNQSPPNNPMKIKLLAWFPFLSQLFDSKQEAEVSEETMLEQVKSEYQKAVQERDTALGNVKTLTAEIGQLKTQLESSVPKSQLDELQAKYDEVAARVPAAEPPAAPVSETGDPAPAADPKPAEYNEAELLPELHASLKAQGLL